MKPAIAIGERRHLVVFQNPGPSVPDGDGGFTQSWTDLSPASLYVSIEPATARSLERVAAGTVLSTASHIVTCPFHAQINTTSRVIFNGRTFYVVGVSNVEELNVELILVCTEIVA